MVFFMLLLHSFIFSLFQPFHLVTFEDCIAAKYISNRMIESHTAPSEDLSTARKWLNNCVQSHPECRSRDISVLPSRLISVAEEDAMGSLKLVPTKALRASVPWIALSYCWGGAQPIQTTRENIQARRSGIVVDTLPATVRDAIYVTREIGQSHLWIDCLCIVQDDEDDKVREINKLPAIYRGTVLAIVAAWAKSCSDGFLYDPAVYEAIPTLLSHCTISQHGPHEHPHRACGNTRLDVPGAYLV
jgi:hypothetical protein